MMKKKHIDGNIYSLVKSTVWISVFERGDTTIVESNLKDPGFDWAIFEKLDPGSLGGYEKSQAAIAIFTHDSDARIPIKWRNFANEICNSNSLNFTELIGNDDEEILRCPTVFIEQRSFLYSWKVINGEKVKAGSDICEVLINKEIYCLRSESSGYFACLVEAGDRICGGEPIAKIYQKGTSKGYIEKV